jgi:uncharacterized protein with GYD domain
MARADKIGIPAPTTKETCVATYLIRGQYSNAAFNGMITSPHDRSVAAKAMFKAVGVKCREIYFSVSAGEIVCLIEGTGEQIAEIGMITMASGAFSRISADELISMASMASAMKKAGAVSGKYKPPNQ